MTSEFSKNDNHDGKLRNCIDIIEVMVSRHVASKDAGRVVPPGERGPGWSKHRTREGKKYR